MRDRVHAATSSAAISRSSATSSWSAPARAARSSRELAEAGSRWCSSRRASTSIARAVHRPRVRDAAEAVPARRRDVLGRQRRHPDPARPDRRRLDDGQLGHLLPHARSRAARVARRLGLDELGPSAMGRYFERVEGVLGVDRREGRAARRQRPRDRARLRRARLRGTARSGATRPTATARACAASAARPTRSARRTSRTSRSRCARAPSCSPAREVTRDDRRRRPRAASSRDLADGTLLTVRARPW